MQVCVVHALPVLGQSAFTLQLPPQPAIGVLMQAPVTTSQLSAVQLFWSLQFLVFVEMHVPLVQWSFVVHALPSEHVLPPPPPPIGWNTQLPDVALQLSAVHWLPSVQTFAPLPMQVPPMHVLAEVHALLSLQTVASALTTELHVDVVRLQNACTHWLAAAGQSTSLAQKPPQPGIGANTQLPAPPPPPWLQESAVQLLESLQILTGPLTHTPPAHWSPVVQALLSVQFSVLLAWVHVPVVGSHASLVHTTLSLQLIGAEPWHTPLKQMSVLVHALPSLHAVALATGLAEQTPAVVQ